MVILYCKCYNFTQITDNIFDYQTLFSTISCQTRLKYSNTFRWILYFYYWD